MRIKFALWLLKKIPFDSIFHQLQHDFKYRIFGRCMRDFLISTEIDSESELDLLLESMAFTKYGFYSDGSIRVRAAQFDKDFDTKVFSNKVTDVCGKEANGNYQK